MSNKVIVTLLVATFMNLCSPALPPNIKVCPRNSPKLAECFKNSMESLRPLLKNGQLAPGFNIEPLDPLYIGDLAANSGFDLKLFKLKAYGTTNFKIEKIRVVVDKVKIEALLAIPSIMTKSTYSLNWQIALLNIQGKGDVTAYLDNVKVLVRLSGSTYVKNGDEYMRIDEVKVEIKPASVRVRFENLFNGQKQLEDVGNDVINQNIGLIMKDVLPEVERGMERKVLQIVNQVFSRATASEFFP